MTNTFKLEIAGQITRKITPRTKKEVLGELAKQHKALADKLSDLEKGTSVDDCRTVIPDLDYPTLPLASVTIRIATVQIEFEPNDNLHIRTEVVKSAINDLDRVIKTAEVLFRSSELEQEGRVSFVKCLGYGISWICSSIAHAIYDMPPILAFTAVATWFGLKEYRKLEKIIEEHAKIRYEMKDV